METDTGSGNVGVNIDTLNKRVDYNSALKTSNVTIRVGSTDYPFPLYMELEPIYTVLEEDYWPSQYLNGETYDSLELAIKWSNLKYVYDEYPRRVGHTVSGAYYNV